MFRSSGIINIENNKVFLDVDQEIGNYYYNLISLSSKINKQRYPYHISIIRDEFFDIETIKKYNNKVIEFLYDKTIYFNEYYCWLRVECGELEELRMSVGLEPTSKITKSPDGRHSFHITVGNFKNIYRGLTAR